MTKEDVEDASGERARVLVWKALEDALNRARWRVGAGAGLSLEWGKSGHPRLRG